VRRSLTVVAAAAWFGAVATSAQLAFPVIELTHPALGYDQPTSDAVASLNRRLDAGEVQLGFEDRTGYLGSVLQALAVPVESQIALFSKTSLQAELIGPENPRTIFFNDDVAVAWMAGGFIEVAAQDPRTGPVFYLLSQMPSGAPRAVRDGRCLRCHYSANTLGVPGYLVRSIPSGLDGGILPWLGNYLTDHRSPLAERWGGWYVTGRAASGHHLGNAPVADRSAQDVVVQEDNLRLTTLAGRFDTRAYLSPHSDIVALLVFDHQMYLLNLLTRLGWEARILAHDGASHDVVMTRIAERASETVDYMLFVNEAPLDHVQGTSEFARSFSAQGPRDSRGRSLRDLDLERRLLRYPCSYMIHSDTFAALPAAAKEAVYRRLWQVLSGSADGPAYAHLSADDRQAIVEILRDTLSDLPDVFSPLPSRH